MGDDGDAVVVLCSDGAMVFFVLREDDDMMASITVSFDELPIGAAVSGACKVTDNASGDNGDLHERR